MPAIHQSTDSNFLHQNVLSLISPVQRFVGFQEEIQFEVLRRLHHTPDLSQRDLAKELGISLGGVNYCFQALIEKGWVKIQNFSQSKHKLHYAYLLTPAGVAEKSKPTTEFLRRKMAEYELLQQEIKSLKADLTYSAGSDQ